MHSNSNFKYPRPALDAQLPEALYTQAIWAWREMEQEQPTATHRTFSQYGPGNLTFLEKKDNDEADAHGHTLRSLVKPFVIKQWHSKGKIYREKEEFIPSRFELFFDLVFVAIAHQLSEAAAEHAGGPGLAQFILTFFPAWSVWSEARAFMNSSGTDDVLQRVCVLFLMALSVGYVANASAIGIGNTSGSEAHSTGGVTSNATEGVAHVLAAVLAEEGTPEAITSEHLSKRDPALVAATVFFLIAKGLRVLFFLMYAVVLPRFRQSLVTQAIFQLIGLFIYFPLLFIHSTPAIITLASLGMATDLLLRYTVGLSYFLYVVLPNKRRQRQQKDLEHQKADTAEEKGPNALKGSPVPENEGPYAPAMNIEHFIERTAAFVVIVLGEMVLSVCYHASTSQIGVVNIFGKAICGLIIAFNLCWLYFDAECSRRFLHALRRHWFSGVTYWNLHFPICASLILVSAALSRMTQHEELMNSALQWYFGGGLGCAMICMAVMGFTHRGLDPTGTTRLGRQTQLGLRLAVGIIFCCLPLSSALTNSALKMLGTCAGLTTFLVIEETYGKLARGEPIAKMSAAEENAAAALRAAELQREEKGKHELEVEAHSGEKEDNGGSKEKSA